MISIWANNSSKGAKSSHKKRNCSHLLSFHKTQLKFIKPQSYFIREVMFVRVVVVFVVVLIGLAYEAIKPPPPKICGSPNGPPVTSPRIKLSDGRFLAYKESGVSKEKSKYKIVIVHGFDNSKHFSPRASQELIDELGIYFLSFDRAGYGESDPNPKRSVKSEAFDIQELADQLELGSKFYIIGASMGGYPVWSCLKYIPHRIAGASLIVPMVNYWWPSFPKNLSTMAFKSILLQDQWVFRVAHYVPGLVYWWNTQKWFPGLGAVEGHPASFSSQDKEILKRLGHILNADEGTRTQQGVFESLHRDMIVGFGNWEFDPLEMSNPFSEDESNTAGSSSSVQIWQGHEDMMIPVILQRYVSEKLPWIRYYEVRDAGHFMAFETRYSNAILRALLLGEEPSDL